MPAGRAVMMFARRAAGKPGAGAHVDKAGAFHSRPG